MSVSIEELLAGIDLAKAGDFAGTFELCAKMADASDKGGTARLYRLAAKEITRLREALHLVDNCSNHASARDLGEMARGALNHKQQIELKEQSA